MGLYFNPPQVVQAAVHAPIAAQGQQPPPFRPIAALMVATSLAWTTPPPVPVQGPRNLAPLTLIYGQQPPRITTTPSAAIRSIWDAQPNWNAQRAQPVAALASLIYGQQPPPSSAARFYAIALGAPPVIWGSQSESENAGWNQTPIAVAQPAPNAALAAAIVAAWNVPGWQAQRAASVAPLTLTYGQQPPIYEGAEQIANLLALPAATWNAQTAPPNAGWNYIPAATNQPPPVSIAGFMAIRWAWPVDAWSTQRARWLAPLTLSYGQQPPAYSIATQASIRATWDAQPWVAQSETENAGWNFTASVTANPPPGPNVNLAIIGAAWSAVSWTAQSEFYNAGWNASTALPAQVPPPRSVILASIVSAWSPVGWATQSETDNAGWNFLPPAVQNPPPGGPHPTAAQLASAWSVSWVSQRAAPVAGFVPPPIIVAVTIGSEFRAAREPVKFIAENDQREFVAEREHRKLVAENDDREFIADRDKTKFSPL
jgi:hypothetical protein